MKENFDMVVLIHSIDKNAMDLVGWSIYDGSIKWVEDDLIKGTTIELSGG